MMGRLDDPSFVGGAALGSLVFNFIYFGFGFLRMATTGLVAQAHGRGDNAAIEHHLVRGMFVAFFSGLRDHSADAACSSGGWHPADCQ